jgi:hypothetical protein
VARPAAHPRLCALRELRGVSRMRRCATRFATGFTRVRRLFERPVQRYPALNRLFCSRLSGLPFTSSPAEEASSTHAYSGFICTFRNFTTPDPYCRATGPLACFESCTSAVFCPLSTTSRWGPCAVIS